VAETSAAKILCIAWDSAMLDSRCAVLKASGYDASSASPEVAESLLRSQEFDLIVVSALSDYDKHRILNLVDGAKLLVLKGLTMPKDLLALVRERLNGLGRK
jgi:DNA-binding response OmpR family regulator